MILLFNGCSHTEGAKITSTKTWANIVCKSLERQSKFFHIKYHKKGQTISKYLNNIEEILQYEENFGISLGKSGKGNDAICFETIESVEKLKDINKKPDYVFIQWSGVSRRMIQLPNNTIEYINPWDGVNYGLPIDPLASELSIYYIRLLESYLKLNNIDYVFLPYMEFDDEEYYKKLSSYKNLDFSNIVLHKDGFGKFINSYKESNLTVDRQGHPTTLGHWFLASEIMDKISLNDSLIGYFDFYKSTDNNTKKYIFNSEIEIEEEVGDFTYTDENISNINQGLKERYLLSSYKEEETDIQKKIFG